jgi:hypothetical protein
MTQDQKVILAYVVGVALGDGNLSRPNKRATRLRVTCDSKYPSIAQEVTSVLRALFPENNVSIVPGPRDSYFNISVYSNKLDIYLPWRVGAGTKIMQKACVPNWILTERRFIRACLRGLFQTDGSLYFDRNYLMANFTNNIQELCTQVKKMCETLGYRPHMYEAAQRSGNPKYTVRLSREVKKFIREIELQKS